MRATKLWWWTTTRRGKGQRTRRRRTRRRRRKGKEEEEEGHVDARGAEAGEVVFVAADPAAHPAARRRKVPGHKLTKGLPRAGKGIGRPMRKAKVQTKAALLAAQAHR